VDQTYASATIDYEKHPDLTPAEKFGYFMGVVTPVCLPWYFATLAGAMLGESIPPSLGLDFALPIAFLAMIGPMLRTPAHRIAALVAVVFALAFAWLPFNLGLMAGAVGGMIAGAKAELKLGLTA
jgi:predicted branched-subunit amino acid permease